MRTNALNAVLLAGALTASLWWSSRLGVPAPVRSAVRTVADAPPPGATEMVDARGSTVPIRDYERIVSLNTIADHLLLDLVEPERLVAITGFTARSHPERWRFGARPSVQSSEEVEIVLSLKPDLVLVSRFANEAYMERLREAGVQVFDLGDMLGVATTRASMRALGALLNERDRARRIEERYVRDLAALEVSARASEPVPGIYLSIYGEHLSGGTAGTSYADVLHYAGVRDLAAEHGFTGWPQYTPEQLVAMDPPLIVTLPGRGDLLRRHSLLSGLRAVREGGRIIEVPENHLDDPALGIVEAARCIQEALHPERAPRDLRSEEATYDERR